MKQNQDAFFVHIVALTLFLTGVIEASAYPPPTAWLLMLLVIGFLIFGLSVYTSYAMRQQVKTNYYVIINQQRQQSQAAPLPETPPLTFFWLRNLTFYTGVALGLFILWSSFFALLELALPGTDNLRLRFAVGVFLLPPIMLIGLVVSFTMIYQLGYVIDYRLYPNSAVQQTFYPDPEDHEIGASMLELLPTVAALSFRVGSMFLIFFSGMAFISETRQPIDLMTCCSGWVLLGATSLCTFLLNHKASLKEAKSGEN